jgi:hypothetical protein
LRAKKSWRNVATETAVIRQRSWPTKNEFRSTDRHFSALSTAYFQQSTLDVLKMNGYRENMPNLYQ